MTRSYGRAIAQWSPRYPNSLAQRLTRSFVGMSPVQHAGAREPDGLSLSVGGGGLLGGLVHGAQAVGWDHGEHFCYLVLGVEGS